MEREIVQLANDVAATFGGPWWRFWQRRRTRAEALHAISHALSGDAAPIQTFGVAMPLSTRTRSGRWEAIKYQLARLSRH